jgi:hypothetical protein
LIKCTYKKELDKQLNEKDDYRRKLRNENEIWKAMEENQLINYDLEEEKKKNKIQIKTLDEKQLRNKLLNEKYEAVKNKQLKEKQFDLEYITNVELEKEKEKEKQNAVRQKNKNKLLQI